MWCLPSCSTWSRTAVVKIIEQRVFSTFTQRSLDVAVIGAPNVGKSLLTNQLVRAAVSAVSSKMDTTTQNVDGIVTEDGVQLTVVDSPGTIGLGHARECGRRHDDRILSDPEAALRRAQHILVVQDATMTGDYIHHRVMHLLHRHAHLTSSLVINKVDLISNRPQLLELTRVLTNGIVAGQSINTSTARIGGLGKSKERTLNLHDDITKNRDEAWQEKYRKVMSRPTHKSSYADTKRLFIDVRGWNNFDNVFYVSALSGEGIDTVRTHLRTLAEERQWRSDETAVTNKSPQDICAESLRAALLDTVPPNVSYRLKTRIVEWLDQGGTLQIVGEIECEKEREGRLVMGKDGKRVDRIVRRVSEHMHTLFQRQLFVRVLIRCRGKTMDFAHGA